MRARSCMFVATALMLAVLVSWSERSTASAAATSTATRSCLKDLAPCLTYLKGHGNGDPPKSCCEPLKDVIKENGECLCRLISNEGSARAEQAGINVGRAQQLPGLCGQHVNPLSCLQLSTGSKTTSSSSSSASIFVTSNSLAFCLISSLFVSLRNYVM